MVNINMVNNVNHVKDINTLIRLRWVGNQHKRDTGKIDKTPIITNPQNRMTKNGINMA